MLENRFARVDLTSGLVSYGRLDHLTSKLFLGGLGVGVKIIYDSIQEGTRWKD